MSTCLCGRDHDSDATRHAHTYATRPDVHAVWVLGGIDLLVVTVDTERQDDGLFHWSLTGPMINPNFGNVWAATPWAEGVSAPREDAVAEAMDVATAHLQERDERAIRYSYTATEPERIK